MAARKIVGNWFADFWFRYPDGRRERIRKRAPVNTKQGAERYEREIRSELLDPSPPPGSERQVPTLKEFSKEFVEVYSATNNKPSTLKNKRMILELHLIPAFGRMRLDQIGPREIEVYKAQRLKKGLSPKTVNNHLTVLRRCLALAVEWRLLTHVPMVKWLRPPRPQFDFLGFKEADRLVAAADAEFHTMILVALRTGLRQGELLGLKWDDIDLVAGRLVVRRSRWRGHETSPKNGKTREIPLSPQAVAALKGERHLRGDYVFCNEDGSPLRDGQCKHPLWGACRVSGLRRVGWHVLRHTFASHLVMRGVPLKVVQELLGHATIEMTMRYSHLSPEVRRDAVMTLDWPATAEPVGQYLGNEGAGKLEPAEVAGKK